MVNYNKRVKGPSPDEINGYCHPARVSTMYATLGKPKFPLSEACNSSRASKKVRDRIVTKDVGPFNLTGLEPFIKLITNVLSRVKEKNPELYSALGTAGCFCCRYVRGSNSQPSNHSWGTAIDFKMYDDTIKDFVLDPRGDGKVQTGCIELYKYFKQYGLDTGDWVFWGAGFATEDGMHFEASDELIRKWAKNNQI